MVSRSRALALQRLPAWLLPALMVPGLWGCNGPFLQLPGGRLEGREAPLSAAAVPPDGGVIELETRPEDPYSVHVGTVVIGGVVYIDPAAERRWYRHLLADPRVRIRFEDDPTVYSARVEPVSDPALLERFDPTRNVLRLVPREAPDSP